MAHGKGLAFLVKVDVGGTPTVIGGARAESISLNNEIIDVTDKGSNEWREILDGAGQKSVTISSSGILDGAEPLATMRSALLAGTLKSVTLVDLAGTWSGSFKITTMELTGEYNGAQQYSATFESSGAVTFS